MSAPARREGLPALAHDLRNSFGTILGSTTLLRAVMAGDEGAQAHVRRIERSVARMQALVEGALEAQARERPRRR